jgi:4'-phosphopantetheinyl transferase
MRVLQQNAGTLEILTLPILSANCPDVVQVLVRRIGVHAAPADVLDLLDVEERGRAKRFVRESDRLCFIEAHGLLRRSLGLYLGVPPQTVAFSRSSYGKPELLHPQPHGVTFSLSHTDGLIAVALANAGRRVGVDVESSERATQPHSLARNFQPLEVAHIAMMPPDQQNNAFLRVWTRKEAVHKADGRGLSLPLNTFAVLNNRCGPWTISDLTLAPGFVGAVAWENAVERPLGEVHQIGLPV